MIRYLIAAAVTVRIFRELQTAGEVRAFLGRPLRSRSFIMQTLLLEGEHH